MCPDRDKFGPLVGGSGRISSTAVHSAFARPARSIRTDRTNVERTRWRSDTGNRSQDAKTSAI